MEKLIILDYTNASVDIYDVTSEANIDEQYIENLGYNINCCSYMFSEDITITHHKEVLSPVSI